MSGRLQVQKYVPFRLFPDVFNRSSKAHQEQLAHVRKGCLARPRDDVRADGSQIEGSHKGWNALQRSFSSGIEMMSALGHDFVLRHNSRIERTLKQPSKFATSTFGSHHIRLVNDCAHRWNKQLARKDNIGTHLEPLPVLNAPPSKETFGMMKMSPETAAHQSLTSVKKESTDDEQELLDLSSQDLLDANHILSEVGVDPSLLYQLPPVPRCATHLTAQLESEPIVPSSMTTPHPCSRPHDAAGRDLASHLSLPSSPPTSSPSQDATHPAFAPAAPSYLNADPGASDSPVPVAPIPPNLKGQEGATRNVFAWGIKSPSVGERSIQKENFDALASPLARPSAGLLNLPDPGASDSPVPVAPIPPNSKGQEGAMRDFNDLSVGERSIQKENFDALASPLARPSVDPLNLNVDLLNDPDGREQKATIVAASDKGDSPRSGVDRKGKKKAVDRSAFQEVSFSSPPSPHVRHN